MNTTECTGLQTMMPEELEVSFFALIPFATHCGSIWAMFVVIRDPQSPPCR